MGRGRGHTSRAVDGSTRWQHSMAALEPRWQQWRTELLLCGVDQRSCAVAVRAVAAGERGARDDTAQVDARETRVEAQREVGTKLP